MLECRQAIFPVRSSNGYMLEQSTYLAMTPIIEVRVWLQARLLCCSEEIVVQHIAVSGIFNLHRSPSAMHIFL